MYERWIQTLDPDRFALEKVRYVVSKLQESGRDFIVMVDPATFSGTPNSSVESYETYQTGVQQNVYMEYENGDIYEGVVWPAPTAFPDWTHPNAQSWWTSEFARFFSAENGVDVSGIWLDMNEPANFLPYVSALSHLSSGDLKPGWTTADPSSRRTFIASRSSDPSHPLESSRVSSPTRSPTSPPSKLVKTFLRRGTIRTPADARSPRRRSSPAKTPVTRPPGTRHPAARAPATTRTLADPTSTTTWTLHLARSGSTRLTRCKTDDRRRLPATTRGPGPASRTSPTSRPEPTLFRLTGRGRTMSTICTARDTLLSRAKRCRPADRARRHSRSPDRPSAVRPVGCGWATTSRLGTSTSRLSGRCSASRRSTAWAWLVLIRVALAGTRPRRCVLDGRGMCPDDLIAS